MLEFNVI